MLETQPQLSLNICDEFILTPFASASLVNEIVKGLVYQKCQIPYPYSWLKQVVEKRRKKLEMTESGSQKMNFTHENHYRIVSGAYDYLRSVMTSIRKEFSEEGNYVSEIVIVFGPSPNCPKEVFRIAIPFIAKGHSDRNHLDELNKHLHKVLRNLFLSQKWLDSIDASTACTNTYIYIKKHVDLHKSFVSDAFELCRSPQVATNIKQSTCLITYNPTERTNCCKTLLIFDEGGNEAATNSCINEANRSGQFKTVWCRSKGILKGFKDCFVNKVSVCELW